MYLFTRSVMLAGPPAASTAHAIELCHHASRTMGRDIALWSAGFGAPLGAMVYAMRVEGLADLEAAAAPLVADAGYHERLAAGQQFHGGPAQDSLAQPLFGELGDESPPVGSVATVTTATMAAGHYGRAVAWSIDIAQHVSAVSGVPTMFLADSFGAFGNVAWIAVTSDMAAADAAGAAVNGDATYLSKLDEAGDLFLPGSGNRVLMTRVA
jgi:hypothetical protein